MTTQKEPEGDEIKRQIDTMNRIPGDEEEFEEEKEQDVEEQEEPEEEEEEEEEEEKETDDRDSIIEDQRKQLDELHGRLTALEGDKPKKEEPQEVEVPDYENVDFVGDVDMEDVTGNKGTFNTLLNKVAKIAYETGSKAAVERSLTAIPRVVKRSVIEQVAIRQASEDFYNTNEDLKGYQRTVGSVAQRLISENPDMTLGELYGEKLATETRKALGLRAKAKEEKPKKGESNKPKFARTPKGAKPSTKAKPKLTGVAADIDAMNQALEK